MNQRQISLAALFILGVLLCPDQSRSVLSQGKSESVPTKERFSISSNEALALLALRHLAVAEYTFQATVGQGRDYGTLEELAAARLINAELASGSKRGYSYKLLVTRATAAGPPSFEVIARPLEYGKTGIRSFHMDYQVTIRDSYVKNARVSDMQPIVHECGSIECAETAAVSTTRLLSSAEATYQSTAGRGRLFGTLGQLRDNQLIGEVLAEGIKDGYLYRVRIDPGSPTEAPSFEVTAVPLEYGVTGRWSFYIDETYVLHGGDKGGAEASSNDPEYSCTR